MTAAVAAPPSARAFPYFHEPTLRETPQPLPQDKSNWLEKLLHFYSQTDTDELIGLIPMHWSWLQWNDKMEIILNSGWTASFMVAPERSLPVYCFRRNNNEINFSRLLWSIFNLIFQCQPFSVGCKENAYFETIQPDPFASSPRMWVWSLSALASRRLSILKDCQKETQLRKCSVEGRGQNACAW